MEVSSATASSNNYERTATCEECGMEMGMGHSDFVFGLVYLSSGVTDEVVADFVDWVDHGDHILERRPSVSGNDLARNEDGTWAAFIDFCGTPIPVPSLMT